MKVCVIGAGAAGLVTAKELQEAGLEVEVLEKRDNLGGLWYLDEKGSSVSTQTSATTSKTFLQFSDFPFDQDGDLFPHHSQYIRYLKRYTLAHHLDRLIHYNCEVVDVTKAGEQWRVKAIENGQPYEKIFDGLAVCSGLHHIPLMPKLAGMENFEGEVIHSAFLKDSTELAGKRVVVVGGGESAADFVHELSPIAAKVSISLRKGIAATRHWSPHGLPGDYDSTRAKVWLPRPYLHDYNVSCRTEDVPSGFKTIFTLLGLPFLLVMLTISYKRAMILLKALFDGHSWAALFRFLTHCFLIQDFGQTEFQYWLVAIPVVIFFAPLGAFFISNQAKSFLLNFLYFVLVLQFAGAVLILKPWNSPPLLGFSLATFMIGLVLFFGFSDRSYQTTNT